MGERVARRVLLLGWDAADWKIIQPLLDAGQMPNLERLIDTGVMGKLATLQPILSPMLWTSVSTGKYADRHGIHGFLEPRPDGTGVRQVTSTSVRSSTLWQILTRRGLRSGVVGWYATHPADAVGGMVVSNRFQHASGVDFDGWPLPSHCVAPESLREIMTDLRVHPADLAREQFLYFVPDGDRIDKEKDRRPRFIARMLAQCASVHAAGTWLAEHETWDLLAVYYDTIDHFCHNFMQYRAPRMAAVSEEDFEIYRDVIDQCYRFHDLMLGRYLELVGPETTVIIISDHGFHSDHLRPPPPGHGVEPALWHRPYGIFVARGPGIRQDQLVFGATLLDIAPTILALLGLPVARDMDGRVLGEIFEHPTKPELVDTHDDLERADPAADDSAEDPWAEQEAVKQLVALGYVDAVPENATKAIEHAALAKLRNLAEVHLSKGEHDKAAALLDELLTHRPASLQARLLLIQCRLRAGDPEGARVRVDELLEEAANSPWGHLAYGQIEFAQQNWDAALAHFHEARAECPSLPNVSYQIGVVQTRRRRWKAAETAFRQALEMDGDQPRVYHGLGLTLCRQRKYQEAVDSLERSLVLLYRQPLVHYQLGMAFAALGELDRAVGSLETALKFRPKLISAHEALADVHRTRADSDRAAHHRSEVKRLKVERRAGAATR